MQNHQHIIVRSVDKTKARAWTNKSEDSPSSQSSFWKDNVDGSDPSIHSAKYDIMCESSTGDHACHLVELGTSHSEGSLISRRIASLILYVLYRGKSLDILAEAIHPFDTEHELLCHSSGNRARHGVELKEAIGSYPSGCSVESHQRHYVLRSLISLPGSFRIQETNSQFELRLNLIRGHVAYIFGYRLF
ncbi:hypothetical protein An16g08240 [Aspergillus niger]|uniref:Uncharacterized protein n=2 Tax=Aspergillus niger TaxID=5061 RepID=A2R8T0_ASPNC|nr:hypothetical protein An16g08240 [Aspergillus niger]CAK47073.1 hypothetical protein An16g08240 [Aspergillus niger]